MKDLRFNKQFQLINTSTPSLNLSLWIHTVDFHKKTWPHFTDVKYRLWPWRRIFCLYDRPQTASKCGNWVGEYCPGFPLPSHLKTKRQTYLHRHSLSWTPPNNKHSSVYISVWTHNYKYTRKHHLKTQPDICFGFRENSSEADGKMVASERGESVTMAYRQSQNRLKAVWSVTITII